MSVAAKILVGIIMMVGSAYVVYWSTGIPGWNLWSAFVTVLEGVIPPLVFLIGLFVVWLEIDEMKIEKELKMEEQKAKTASKPRKK